MAPLAEEAVVNRALDQNTINSQIVSRLGIVYDGDLSITISLVIFIGITVAAIIWSRRYPDHRRNPDKDFVVFLLDPRNNDRGARVGQAGLGQDGNNNNPQDPQNQNQGNNPPPPPAPPGGGAQAVNAAGGGGLQGAEAQPNPRNGGGGGGGGGGGFPPGPGGGHGGGPSGPGVSHSGTPQSSTTPSSSGNDPPSIVPSSQEHAHAKPANQSGKPSLPAPSGSVQLQNNQQVSFKKE